MALFKAGKLVTAALLNNALGVAVASLSSASATTTGSTAYTETWTGGTPAGVAFVAPTSGKVIIRNSAFVDNNGAATIRTYLSWILRNGAVVGSGTTVSAANDTWAISQSETRDVMVGRSTLVTGLTPGNSYNVNQAMRTNNAANTATSEFRRISVKPTN